MRITNFNNSSEFTDAVINIIRNTININDYEVYKRVIVVSEYQNFTEDGLSIRNKKMFLIDEIIFNMTEKFYEYCNSSKTINQIAQEILNDYKSKARLLLNHDFTESVLSDFEKFKDCIIYYVMPYEGNELALSLIPHMRFMDIIICFDILIELKEKGMSCVHITNKMLEVWNVKFKTILEYAVVNTSRLLPYKLEQIAGSTDDLDFEEWGSEFADSGIEEVQLRKVYLLTNCVSSFGAGTLLYPDILKQVAEEVGDDIVILPNSLHEVLIVAMSTFYEHEIVEVCYEMLQEGNKENDVAAVLSNKVYAYLKDTGKFDYLENIIQNK